MRYLDYFLVILLVVLTVILLRSMLQRTSIDSLRNSVAVLLRRFLASRLTLFVFGFVYECLGTMARAYALDRFHYFSGPLLAWWILLLIPLTAVVALTRMSFKQGVGWIAIFVAMQLFIGSEFFLYRLVWGGWFLASYTLSRNWWLLALDTAIQQIPMAIVNFIIQLAVLRLLRMHFRRRRIHLAES